jgi:hypothetical protein
MESIKKWAQHGIFVELTGIEYVFVACSFIRAAVRRLAGQSPEI